MWVDCSYSKTGKSWGNGLHVRHLFGWSPHHKNLHRWRLKDRNNNEYKESCPLCNEAVEDMTHWILKCPATGRLRRKIENNLESRIQIFDQTIFHELMRDRSIHTALLLGGLITRKKWDIIKIRNEDVKERICKEITGSGCDQILKIWHERLSRLYDDK